MLRPLEEHLDDPRFAQHVHRALTLLAQKTQDAHGDERWKFSVEDIRSALANEYGADMATMVMARCGAEYASELLCAGLQPPAVCRMTAVRFKVAMRTAYTYLNRAWDILGEICGLSEDEHRHWVGGMFLQVARDPKASPHAKVAAISNYARMFGLYRPLRVALTTRDGDDRFTLQELVATLEGNPLRVIGQSDVKSLVDQVCENAPNGICDAEFSGANSGNGR